MKQILLHLISTYQKALSPLLGSNCRFYPTCSSYAKTAIENKGLIVGTMLMLSRLLRCNPFHRGGYDPVGLKEKTRG